MRATLALITIAAALAACHRPDAPPKSGDVVVIPGDTGFPDDPGPLDPDDGAKPDPEDGGSPFDEVGAGSSDTATSGTDDGTDGGGSDTGSTDSDTGSDTDATDSDGSDTGSDTGDSDTGGTDTGDTASWDTGDTASWDTGDTGYVDWDDDDDDSPDELPPDEEQARDDLAVTTIDLSGRVVDATGQGIPGVTVGVAGRVTLSDAGGSWRVEGLSRHNELVRFTATGWRDHLAPVWLYRPLDVDEVVVDQVVLTEHDPATVRFVFGGDVSLGGAYMDPERLTPPDEVPPDDPEALIQSSDPLPGARDVLSSVAPYLLAADYPVVNLEGAVTAVPDTPNTTKEYHRFMLPETVQALAELGVSYVSLGNDHTYDYLEAGIDDTWFHLGETGVTASGLGHDPAEAWAPWRETLAGAPYSFVSATSSSGRWQEISYVADDTKGGAADLTDVGAMRSTVMGERDAGRIPLALFHMGRQYIDYPSAAARTYAAEAVDAGAALVIGHGPHWSQGFGEVDGVPVAWSLGDLALPLGRLDTVFGLLVQADLRGETVEGLQGVPVLRERYVPRPLAGELADVALRTIAERSDVPTFPWGNRLEVLPAGVPHTRTVTVPVEVGPRGWAVVDLRDDLRPGESLAMVRGPVTVRIGRDLLLFGTVEDQDVDDEDMEVPYFGVSGASRFPCATGARRGAVGLCSTRSSANIGPSVITVRNRIRVEGDKEDRPNKHLTVLGWRRGLGSGPLSIIARYKASRGDLIIGEETVWTGPGGTFDWRSFAADIHVPEDVEGGTDETNPRAVRVFFRHDPPATDSGIVHWDDLALISWAPAQDATSGVDLDTPHARDFVRVEAAPGTYDLQVTLRGYRRFE